MEKKPKFLSASSVKCLETCSYLYYCQYEIKVPQKSGEAASRGSTVHTIFESLLNPRHKKHVDIIMRDKTINASPAVRRLLIKELKSRKILTTQNYDSCNQMILVGLRTDFLGKSNPNFSHIVGPEYRFEIENESPKYKIRGFIDKMFFYKDGTAKVVDYKSSKKKFSLEDLDANIQSMTYSLAAYKKFDAIDVTAEFIFLRFPKQAVQMVHPSKEQLKGFEDYLGYVYEYVSDFDEKKARINMAAYNKENSWMCKAGATWECPYLREFDYYGLTNENGSIARTSLEEKDLVPQPGQQVLTYHYAGCPAWRKKGKI